MNIYFFLFFSINIYTRLQIIFNQVSDFPQENIYISFLVLGTNSFVYHVHIHSNVYKIGTSWIMTSLLLSLKLCFDYLILQILIETQYIILVIFLSCYNVNGSTFVLTFLHSQNHGHNTIENLSVFFFPSCLITSY